MAEVQGKWIIDCLTWLRSENKAVIEPDHEAEEVWKAENDQAAKRILYLVRLIHGIWARTSRDGRSNLCVSLEE